MQDDEAAGLYSRLALRAILDRKDEDGKRFLEELSKEPEPSALLQLWTALKELF